MNRLTEILDNKKREIEILHESYEPDLEAMQRPRPSFLKALQSSKNLSVIAELKRRSPSEGELNINADPRATAALYAQNGASAISILTDKKFFGGGMDFLEDIFGSVPLPLLCKEFILDPFQIDLAREHGASAVLLITDILDDEELASLYHYSRDMELDVLLEAHSPENIERAAELRAPIIGINNRNLASFEIDINHSVKYLPLLPEFSIKLSLSAVNTPEDGQMLARAGFDGILVGSSLMKAAHPEALLQELSSISRH